MNSTRTLSNIVSRIQHNGAIWQLGNCTLIANHIYSALHPAGTVVRADQCAGPSVVSHDDRDACQRRSERHAIGSHVSFLQPQQQA